MSVIDKEEVKKKKKMVLGTHSGLYRFAFLGE